MPSDTHAIQKVYTAIMVTFAPDGSYTAIAHQSWTLTGDSEKLKQIQFFNRGNHHIKLATYGRHVTNIAEWGAWLCAALIDKDERVWRTVDLNADF